MAIRLVATDVDGTLLTSDCKVAEQTKQAIRRALEHGVEVVMCTGRNLAEGGVIVEQLPQMRYAITGTGSHVMRLEDRMTIARNSLTAEEGRRIYKIMRQYDALVSYFVNEEIHNDKEQYDHIENYISAEGAAAFRAAHTPEPDLDAFVEAWDGPVDKLHITFHTAQERDKVMQELQDLPYYFTSSTVSDIEIVSKNADKGNGLRQLAEYLGLDRSEVLAIGDNYNDWKMLEYAGTSVVVANALPDLKEKVDLVAPSNDENGVAWVLNKIVEGEI